MEASLYVHVPFCLGKKCDYCDFYSVPANSYDEILTAYVDTVLMEASRLLKKYSPEGIPTLYIGGGTPSILGAAGIRHLLDRLLELIRRFSPSPVEITVEANPESASEAFLAAVCEGGATRLSLGVQSLHRPSREAVGRSGDESGLLEKLRLAASYFPDSLSVDILSGLPLQSEDILYGDIAALLSCKPAHVSLYSLTIEDETPLALHSEDFFQNQDEADQLWIYGRDLLEKAGYSQYEISNFSRPGKESIHNIRYWRMQSWLALGPAASGTIIREENAATTASAIAAAARYTIPPNLNAWLNAGGCVFSSEPSLAPIEEKLDAITLIKETILMGYRFIEGPDEKLFFRRFNKHIEDIIPKTLTDRRERGLLRKDRNALTKEGLLFLNSFVLDAFRELDAHGSLNEFFPVLNK